MSDDHAPRIFRVLLQVGDLDRAAAFYERLLGIPARQVGGGRVYLDCGSVILALVDVSRGGLEPTPAPSEIYFSLPDLNTVFDRAAELDCLSAETVHDQPAGEITVQPWGERCFYAVDPWGNPLCFADDKTLFTGRR